MFLYLCFGCLPCCVDHKDLYYTRLKYMAFGLINTNTVVFPLAENLINGYGYLHEKINTS